MKKYFMIAAMGLLVSQMLAPQAALAIGGSGEDVPNQVNRDTLTCQTQIRRAVGTFQKSVVAGVGKCFDAFIKCDQQTTTAKAQACRAALLVPGKGRCAVGKLDEGVALAGNVSQNYATNFADSRATVVKALNKLSLRLNTRCTSVPGVVLSQSGQGLNFNPTPLTNFNLVDSMNQNNRFGIFCGAINTLSNNYRLTEDVLAANDNVVSQIGALHNKCVKATNPADLYVTPCSLDADCGATGVCGKAARSATLFNSQVDFLCL